MLLKMGILKRFYKKSKNKKQAPHIELGKRGEDEACNYLKKQGYNILERDFRCRFGQIDIIADDDNTLCFIEVKSRSSHSFGHPEEAITNAKSSRIKKISEYYMLLHKINNRDCRYDVVAIFEPKNGKRQINLIKNAF